MFRQGCEPRRKYLSAWPLGGRSTPCFARAMQAAENVLKA